MAPHPPSTRYSSFPILTMGKRWSNSDPHSFSLEYQFLQLSTRTENPISFNAQASSPLISRQDPPLRLSTILS